MADEPAVKPSSSKGGGGKDTFGFLTKKVFGIPIWVIAVAAVGLWYWYTHYGPGKKNAAPAPAAKPAKAARGARTRVVVVRAGGGNGNGDGGRRHHHKHRGGTMQTTSPELKKTGTNGTAMADNSPEAIAGQSSTYLSPDYQNWVANQNGVPEPGTMYAPMTPGSVYG